MSAIKSPASVDVWAEIAQAGFREGAVVDLQGVYSAVLHIDVALSSTTAHDGTEIIVLIGTDTGDADDNWSILVRYTAVTGTAVLLALAATEPVGETVIAVTDPVTANMDNDKKFKFIENTTPADSEIVYQISNSGDAGDTITLLKGLTHEQDITTSIIYDIDNAKSEALSMHQIDIPNSADRAQVYYNNNFDSGGSTVFVRCRVSKLTGI